jgi:hypothetical protein
MLKMNAPEMEGQGGKIDFRRGRCTGDGGSGRENRHQAGAVNLERSSELFEATAKVGGNRWGSS